MASSMGPAKMVTDGLVLHLDAGNTKSYPGSGTVWTDLSQTAITGSLTNGPTFSSVNGGSLVFDGTNDYVILPNITTNNFTLECWIRTTVTSLTGTDAYQGNGIIWSDIAFDNNDFVLAILNNKPSWFTGNPGTSINGTTVINNGNWYHITATKDGINGIKSLFVNGILEITGSTNSNILNANPNIVIGGNTLDSRYLNGSVSQVKIYNRALSANEVFQNYEATRERFNRPTIVTDDDARNFLNSANISSETQQRAVNDLVVDLKNVGLWGKMKAIYPFVGGTAASHKWNLKDPRDVDAAFRLTFSGGWTHSSTGADPNGTTGYADTFLVPSTHLSQNSSHISYYSRNARSVGDSVVIGSTNASLTNRIAIQLNLSGLTYVLVNGTSPNDWVTIADTVETGYYIGYRNSATIVRGQRNNTQYSANVNSTGLTSRNIYIGAYNNNGTAGFYADNQCAFATIGDGLTDTDAANLYTIVQKYQTTLGRQV
jgi:hypothetical protein